MQMMYVMAFLVALFVLALSQGRDSAESAAQDSAAVAGHMAAWHGAAHRHCSSTLCAGGLLDVRPLLPPMLRNAPAFSDGRFVTRIDNVNGLAVTYMSAGYATRGSVTFGGVSAALADLAGINSESSSFGVWRAATSRVEFSVPPPTGARFIQLPSPFMGGSIPDGSPVILGRL